MDSHSIITLIGVISGIFGIGAYFYQVYRQRLEVEKVEEQKNNLREERDEIIEKKEEYQETIEETKDYIKDLQDMVLDGEVNQENMVEILNRLESSILPESEQIISNLNRVQDIILNNG